MTPNTNPLKRKITPKKAGLAQAASAGAAGKAQQMSEARGKLQKSAAKKKGSSLTAGNPPAFLEAVRKLQAEVSALRRQPGLDAGYASQLETVDKRLAEAVDEAQKPQPDAAALSSTLGNARLLLTRLSAGLPEAAILRKKAAGLVKIAKQLFQEPA
ncbi:MAG TPA: hypothetical protein PKM21_14410 [Anaerolineales bacterium]|nr:hypothetical protein [Anaerolineales bacterium]